MHLQWHSQRPPYLGNIRKPQDSSGSYKIKLTRLIQFLKNLVLAKSTGQLEDITGGLSLASFFRLCAKHFVLGREYVQAEAGPRGVLGLSQAQEVC